jgi:uncharacterized protein (DUF1778 family)
LSTPRTGPVSSSQTLPDPEARNLPRAKTVATRLSPEELDEIESAAKRSGKQLAAWLRDVALEAARPTPDTSELLLAEVAATRFMLLNLFHASATATQDGAHLTPETVLKIRETADSRKQQTARKLLQDFVAAEVKTGGDPR